MLTSRFLVLRFLISGVFIASSGFLFSQTSNTAFSAYLNFSISDEPVNSWRQQDITISSNNSDFTYFSPAVLLYSEKGNFQEFEISRFGFHTWDATVYALDSLDENRIPQMSGGASVANINIALRYTYSFLISPYNSESRFKFYIGVAGEPYFQSDKLRPLTSNLFPVSTSRGGMRVSVIPALTFSLTDHWFLNLNVPLPVANAFLTSSKTENPVVPVSDRKSSTIDFNLFPNEFLVRFGLGLRI